MSSPSLNKLEDVRTSEDNTPRASGEQNAKSSVDKTPRNSEDKTPRNSEDKTPINSEEKGLRKSQDKTPRNSEEQNAKSSVDKTPRNSEEKERKSSKGMSGWFKRNSKDKTPKIYVDKSTRTSESLDSKGAGQANVQANKLSDGESAQNKATPSPTEAQVPLTGPVNTKLSSGVPQTQVPQPHYTQGPGYYGPPTYSQYQFAQQTPQYAAVATNSCPCGCCGCSLASGTSAVASIGIVAGGIITLWGIFMFLSPESLIDGSVKYSLFSKKERDRATFEVQISGCFYIVRGVIDLIMHSILCQGANKRSESACTAWLIYDGILLLFSIVSSIWQIFSKNYNSFYVCLLYILWFYFFWVVYAFRQEIRMGQLRYPQGQGVMQVYTPRQQYSNHPSNTQMAYGQGQAQPQVYNATPSQAQMNYNKGPQQYQQYPQTV